MTTTQERPDVQKLTTDLQPNLVAPIAGAYLGRLHLLRFRDTDKARAWLTSLNAQIFESGADNNLWYNCSFTYPGLVALGVSPIDLSEFPSAFREGMLRRAKRLADPPLTQDIVHAALLVLHRPNVELQEALVRAGTAAQQRATDDPSRHALPALLAQTLDQVCFVVDAATRDAHAIELVASHDLHQPLVPHRDELATVEYFGFRDGVSQPSAWTVGGGLNPQIVLPSTGRLEGSLLARGSFLVARKLEQDVERFWRSVSTAAARAGVAPEELAERMVGRRRDGTPLEAASPAPPAPSEYDTASPPFVHKDADETAAPRCPFQSHVRRMNPMLEAQPHAARNPRLLRRAMSYIAADGTRGLMFMAFNADLESQFEFIQANWLQRGNFAGGFGDQRDPIASHDAAETTSFVAGGQPPIATSLQSAVSLRWGEYFFLPARRAFERIANPEAAPLPVTDRPPLASALAWINDPFQAASFWNRCVPERGLELASPPDHSGQTQRYVFVKNSATVRALLADPRPTSGFSVCEYGKRLRTISGPFVLGMDTDTQDYQREVRTMNMIPVRAAETQQIAQIAQHAATKFLNNAAARAQLQRLTQSDAIAVIRSAELIAFTLSAVWGERFGIPGPGSGSLLIWAQEITDAVFRVGTTEIKFAQAEQTGKDLRAYVMDLVVKAHADPASNPALSSTLEHFCGSDDDDTTRMLTGILVGSMTAVAGTFVPGLARFALQAKRDVAEALTDALTQPRHPAYPDWPLYRALAGALEHDALGGPDYLYRTYRGSEPHVFPNQDHVTVQPGDIVVSWIGGAASADDTPNTEIRFGAGSHMCPGREMARAIIDGVLSALAQRQRVVPADDRATRFEIDS